MSEKKERMSQRKAVLDWLSTGAGITSKDAFEAFGATRLSAIIFDLRKRGHDIRAETVSGVDRYGNKTRFARYYLVGKEAEGEHEGARPENREGEAVRQDAASDSTKI